MAIPLPRRGLRSLFVLLCLICGPYLIFRQIRGITTPSTSEHLQDRRKHDPRDVPGLVVQPQKGNTPAGKGKEKSQKGLAQHSYLANGLVEVNPKGQHPIYDLLDRGHDAWNTKLAGASRTLGQAVDEYRRRYSRAPPKGFDRW